jgi:hypothetical protein
MKKLLLVLCFFTTALMVNAQSREKFSGSLDPAKKLEMVEAACGQCKFGLKGKGCSLAVRIDQKAYFVDGTDIDDHGDAHAKDGFCNSVRKAEVQGTIVNQRFKSTYFKLVKDEVKKD